jgi:hypothetical protein
MSSSSSLCVMMAIVISHLEIFLLIAIHFLSVFSCSCCLAHLWSFSLKFFNAKDFLDINLVRVFCFSVSNAATDDLCYINHTRINFSFNMLYDLIE